MILRCPRRAPSESSRSSPRVRCASRSTTCSREGLELEPGDVVHVPLAGRSVRGVVVEAGGESQHEGELAVVERLADEPRIAPVVLELCLWIASLLRLDAGPGARPRAAAARARAARHVGLGDRRAGDDASAGARCSRSWPTARCRWRSWSSAPGRRPATVRSSRRTASSQLDARLRVPTRARRAHAAARLR